MTREETRLYRSHFCFHFPFPKLFLDKRRKESVYIFLLSVCILHFLSSDMTREEMKMFGIRSHFQTLHKTRPESVTVTYHC